MSKGKILVIRGGAIGDFILTLPVFSALRENFPETHLEVLGYSHIASLALACGLVDGVRSIEARSLAGFFARGGTLDGSLQEYFAGFSVIISYLYDPDAIFATNVAGCSKAQYIQGPHRPCEVDGIHATEVFLKPLERMAIFNPDPMPRLKTRATSLPSPAVAGAPPLLAVHPGSGSERKNWPEANWKILLQEVLKQFRGDLLLAGGEAEENKLERLAEALPAYRYKIVRNRPLPELGERLTECAAFVGHDSGISHLVAALGLPSLLLWGQTAEQIWAPRAPQIKILREPGGLTALSVEQVLSQVRQLLPPSALI